MIAATDVEVGQYAYSSQIKPSDKIDPFETIDLTKYRKVSIPISYETSVSGEIKKGDKVDLVYTGLIENEKDGEGSYSKTFMQDVLVYSVTTGEGFEYVNHSSIKKSETVTGDEDDENTISVEDLTAPALVTLAVPINQAEEVLARLEMGNIKILGRFDDSENVNTSGFVFGIESSDTVFAGEKNIEKNN